MRFQEAIGQIAEEIHLQELGTVSRFGLAKAAAMEWEIQEAKIKGGESFQIFKKIGLSRADEVKLWLKTLG